MQFLNRCDQMYHMEWKKLTVAERKNLMKRHRLERDKRICDRIKAVLAYDDGYNYAEIAKILLLDDETIRRHIYDYEKLGKLSTDNGGSQGKLSCSEIQELKKHLAEVTYMYVKDIVTIQQVSEKFIDFEGRNLVIFR